MFAHPDQRCPLKVSPRQVVSDGCLPRTHLHGQQLIEANVQLEKQTLGWGWANKSHDGFSRGTFRGFSCIISRIFRNANLDTRNIVIAKYIFKHAAY